MATYAIGDIQGCFKEFRLLLNLIAFEPKRDQLWLVGDLVNRGPESLAVLRFAKSLGDAAISVLGNHDLHLLAVAEGFEKSRSGDTIHDILNAPDRNELLDWLRKLPMIHVDGGYAMVHAGLLPSWRIADAKALAREVEIELRGENYRDFLANMYGNYPDRWSENLTGFDRLRIITNAMTRLRICTPDGVMELDYTGPADETPEGFLPWYAVPGRASEDTTVICGHWSALGLFVTHNLIALDTGCLWGGSLSCLRLEDRKLFHIPCAEQGGPGRQR